MPVVSSHCVWDNRCWFRFVHAQLGALAILTWCVRLSRSWELKWFLFQFLHSFSLHNSAVGFDCFTLSLVRSLAFVFVTAENWLDLFFTFCLRHSLLVSITLRSAWCARNSDLVRSSQLRTDVLSILIFASLFASQFVVFRPVMHSNSCAGRRSSD